jgi:hypothetical protein
MMWRDLDGREAVLPNAVLLVSRGMSSLLGVSLLACVSACSSHRGTSGGVPTKKDSSVTSTACTRDGLSGLVGNYFDALAAHDASTLPLARTVKFTENTQVASIGDGFWQTAGALDFRRDLIDAEHCATVTQAIVEEQGKQIIFALRLQVAMKRITEIETIVVRGEGVDSIWFHPDVIADTPQPEWDDAVPKDAQSTRDDLVALADQYFDLFVDGDVSTFPFADDCSRYEDGLFTTGNGGCPAFITPGGTIGARRYPAADAEHGIVAGFTLAEGTFLDLHMFKVSAGKVERIQAVMTSQIGGSADTGWD